MQLALHLLSLATCCKAVNARKSGKCASCPILLENCLPETSSGTPSLEFVENKMPACLFKFAVVVGW